MPRRPSVTLSLLGHFVLLTKCAQCCRRTRMSLCVSLKNDDEMRSAFVFTQKLPRESSSDPSRVEVTAEKNKRCQHSISRHCGVRAMMDDCFGEAFVTQARLVVPTCHACVSRRLRLDVLRTRRAACALRVLAPESPSSDHFAHNSFTPP